MNMDIISIPLYLWKSALEYALTSIDPHVVREFIPHSFTLIAGFVAIGIPLGVQAVSRAVEKYKSEYLVSYLTSWKGLTPARIYWIAVVYVLLSTIYLFILPKEDSEAALKVSLGVHILGCLIAAGFTSFFIMMGGWYAHLIKQAQKKPSEIFDGLIEFPHRTEKTDDLPTLICRSKLEARVSLYREAMKDNPTEAQFGGRLDTLMADIQSLIRFNNSWSSPLTQQDWSVYIFAIRTFFDLSEFGKSHNRGLYFSSQRRSFELLGFLLKHPDYSKLCQDWRNEWALEVFQLRGELYDQAEKQNHSPSLSGDLFASGEWCSDFFSNIGPAGCFPHSAGLSESFLIWEDTCRSAAEKHPYRLVSLFNSLRGSCTSNLCVGLTPPIFFQPEPNWYPQWVEMFEELPRVGVRSLDYYLAAFRSIRGEETGSKWDLISEQIRGDERQVMPEITDQSIYRECIEASAFESLAVFFGECAKHGRWAELKSCWYVSHPEESSSSHGDHDFFKRDPGAMLRWAGEHIATKDFSFRSFDRTDLSVFIGQACVVLMADIICSEGSFGAVPTCSTVRQYRDVSQLFDRLKGATSKVIDRNVAVAFGWSRLQANDLKVALDSYISDMEVQLKEGLRDELSKCTPDIKSNSRDRDYYYGVWQRTNDKFWERFELYKYFSVSMGNCLRDNILSVKFNNLCAPYYFSSRSGQVIMNQSFGGEVIADLLTAEVAEKLHTAAVDPVSSIEPNDILLVSKSDWDGEFNELLSDRYKIDVPEAVVLPAGLESSLVIKPGAASLVIHEWKGMPWGASATMPSVVYGFVDFNEEVSCSTSLYFQLHIHDPSKIAFLPKLRPH